MRAVSGLSLEVPEGSVFALIGANGAGKTSTLMAIAGHVEIQGGRVLFRNRDLTLLPPIARVEVGIALIPEGRRLFADLSVTENLIIGGYARPARRFADNRDFVLELFPRLAERLHLRAGNLSGGEQQMVAIGRALMAEPKLLLVDEISLGLMPTMVDACYAALGTLNARGMTVLLVEQSPARAFSVADQICVLESGRPVYQGSAAEARANSGLIDTYLGLGAAAT